MSPFTPSLACIAEETPRIIGQRRITVATTSGKFHVEIPIFDVNIYAPKPRIEPMSKSMQKLLAEMDKYVGKSGEERHRMMAASLRQQLAVEQAEQRRLSKPNFTDRDWYWYAEETGNFIDTPMEKNEKNSKKLEKNKKKIEKKPEIVEIIGINEEENVFDLDADF